MTVTIGQRYRLKLSKPDYYDAEVTVRVKVIYPYGGEGGPMVAECIIETIHSDDAPKPGLRDKQVHYINQPWGIYVSDLEQMTPLP